jgi:hypothetical protein
MGFWRYHKVEATKSPSYLDGLLFWNKTESNFILSKKQYVLAEVLPNWTLWPKPTCFLTPFFVVCCYFVRNPLFVSFGSIKSHIFPYKSSNTATVPYSNSVGRLTKHISLSVILL